MYFSLESSLLIAAAVHFSFPVGDGICDSYNLVAIRWKLSPWRYQLKIFRTTSAFLGRSPMWTLVSADDFRCNGDTSTLDFSTAMKRNQMGLLGDAFIGTTPPLSLRFYSDKGKPHRAAITLHNLLLRQGCSNRTFF